MASELKVDKFTGVTTAGSIDVTGEGNSTTTNLQQGLAKAWVGSFDFDDNSVIDSFNVSTFTDNGSGELITNFSNAMANAGFSTTVSDNNYSLIMVAAQATTSTRTDSHTTAFAAWDDAIQKLTVHGDLA